MDNQIKVSLIIFFVFKILNEFKIYPFSIS